MRALFFAILCLIFTSCNDFLFKLFGRRRAPMGGFVFIVGLMELAVALADWPEFGNTAMTLLWGIVAGLLSVTANLLLIAAMGHQPGGVVSTIYRLNMVGVILGGWLIFKEPISLLHWWGIFCATMAVLCFFPSSKERTAQRSATKGFVLAGCAMLLRAAMGLAYKQGVNTGGAESGLVLMNSCCWIAGGFLWYLVAEKPKGASFLVKRAVFYGIGNGIVVYMVLRTTVEMFAAGGAVSITLPLAQMSFIPTFALGIIFLKEKVDARKICGVCAGIAAVIILAMCTQAGAG